MNCKIQQFSNICSSETCLEGQEVEVTLLEKVKERVTARQAAEHYGIKVKRNGKRKRKYVRICLLFKLH